MPDNTRRGLLGLGAGAAFAGVGGFLATRPPQHQEITLSGVTSAGSIGNDVRVYGAAGDGITDDTAAIAAACANGGTVYFPTPPAFYKTTAPIPIVHDTVFLGSGGITGVGGTAIKNTVSDMFIAQSSMYGASFEGLSLTASAGHIFNFGNQRVSALTIRNCALPQRAVNKSVMQANHLTDSLFTQLNITHSLTATVPTFNLVSTGNDVNTNTWFRIRFTYTGTYAIHIENTLAGGYCNDNTFRDINFEVANGGMIRLLSCHGTVIENVQLYDPTTVKRDLVYIGKSPAGPGSTYTTIRHFKRLGGTLAAGVVDLRLQADNVTRTHLQSCDTSSGGGFIVDLGHNAARIDNCPGLVLQNVGPGTYASRSNPSTPGDMYLRQADYNGGIVLAGAGGKSFQQGLVGNHYVLAEVGVGHHTRFRAGGDLEVASGDVVAAEAGTGLRVKEGANAKMGAVRLVAGGALVTTNKVTANSRIFLTTQVPGGVVGALIVSARTPGSSFTIRSLSGTDASIVAWMIVEPSA